MKLTALYILTALMLCACPCLGNTDGRVVLVVAANISVRDLVHPGLHNISRLFETGSGGLVNVHTGRSAKDILPAPRAGMEAECVSLGAGAMAVGGMEVWYGSNSTSHVEDATVADIYTLTTGSTPGPAEVLHTRISRIARTNAEASYHALPGALGSALQQAGIRTAVIGNSDTSFEPHREAVAIAMNTEGRVDLGDVSSPALHRRDPRAPYGFRTNPDHLLSELDRLPADARFVVIDFGDTYRADLFSELSTQDRADLLRYQAALRLDDFIGSLSSRLDFARDTLILLSPSPRILSDIDRESLPPIIIRGPSYQRGTLSSPSTRRAGVVTLSDVAPTILGTLGVGIPPDMVGRPVTSLPGPISAPALIRLNLDAATQAQRQVIMRWASILQSFIVILVTLALLASAGDPIRRLSGWAALVPVTIPISMLSLPLFYSGGLWGAVALLILLTAVLIVVFRRLSYTPLRALVWMCGVLVVGLAIDMLLGAPLTSASIAGYSLTEGARYYGIGNELMGTLLGAALIGTGIALSKSRSSDLLALLIFAAVFLTIGLPVLGANLGGALASVPAMGVALLTRRGWKPNIRGLALITLLTAAVIGSLFAVDYLRGGSAQSHMGRVVGQAAGGGLLEILSVMQRKLTLNALLLVVSPWSRLLGLSVASSAILLLWAGRRLGSSPLSHSERAGVAGAGVGVVGALVFNDSGVVAAATCSVILWTLIALRALSPHQTAKGRRAGSRTSSPA